MGENMTYTGFIGFTDRMDYINALSNNFSYCVAVEKLGPKLR
jgi:NADH-quinone oxidoreductase subunit D